MLITGLVACAGANLAKFNDDGQLPDDLPVGLKEQFTTREEKPTQVSSPSSASGQSSTPSGVEGTNATETSLKPKDGKSAQVSKTSSRPSQSGTKKNTVENYYPNRRPKVDPIWLGERHEFAIEYLGVNVGNCDLEVVSPKLISGRRAYHVKGHGWSNDVFGLFYRIDDRMESLFDFESLVSHKFRIMLDESRVTRDSQEFNDPLKAKGFFWNRMNTTKKGYVEKKVFVDIPPLSQDSLSQLYFLRTLPLKTGDHLAFPLVSEGRVLVSTAEVLGREELDSPMGKVRTVKIRPETRYQGRLKRVGDSFVWLTDDDRRIIVRVEARVKLGTVAATLKKFDPGSGPIPTESSAEELRSAPSVMDSGSKNFQTSTGSGKKRAESNEKIGPKPAYYR
jgi:hypothetical protein